MSSKSVADQQIEWLSKLQTSNGAIRDSLEYAQYKPARYKITPYYANVAASAMTKDKKKLSNVSQYIRWYLAHLNMGNKDKSLDGTIYDYYITPDGIEYCTYEFDSADAYAATFLSLVRSYYKASNDKKLLLENKAKILAVYKAIIQLLDKDNLTWAKENYHVKFLMDNCEVYKGLVDAALIIDQVFSDKTLSRECISHAANVKSAIMTNMSIDNEFYSYKDTGSYNKINWHKWYPDTTSQVYPVVFGIIDPKSPQANNISDKINKNWDWVNLKASTDFPWVIVGYMNSLMGNRSEVEAFYNNILEKYMKKDGTSPTGYWNSLESGWFVLLSQEMEANGRDLFRK